MSTLAEETEQAPTHSGPSAGPGGGTTRGRAARLHAEAGRRARIVGQSIAAQRAALTSESLGHVNQRRRHACSLIVSSLQHAPGVGVKVLRVALRHRRGTSSMRWRVQGMGEVLPRLFEDGFVPILALHRRRKTLDLAKDMAASCVEDAHVPGVGGAHLLLSQIKGLSPAMQGKYWNET
eukprot:CAMPEP_0204129632 /NCGR_PEP_ID=MMETSP0361-20130328/12891_1 /ASSEMBLY_ACC=CAM_ASM_000343 /TAXON_ID=268821 /ORGANISM="Scrippsiella Hangoei, Strain SHTV-5" /LENGTH=178 /DNA_ID=CAMNT_0051082081 /DNA_START=26 /DNA_END=560 /DNA_ORIENTATION=+